LEVQDFLNVISGEDVVVASCSFHKSQMRQKLNKLREPDIGIGPSTEDTFKKLCVLSHGTSTPLNWRCQRLTKAQPATLFTLVEFLSVMGNMIARPVGQSKNVGAGP
jgi:hypothetical protein